ncbi:MAG: asparaginase domain-containing protein [Pseudomonadota bacterium]
MSYEFQETSLQPITFISTGGTIDKVYFDAASEFEVGESVVQHILREALVGFEWQQLELMRKDSLEITEADREQIADTIRQHPGTRFIVTHGTDTMADTAERLRVIEGKTIVLTGALTPARFRTTDAVFNVGLAVAAVQVATAGVYIAMSGQIFKAGDVRKNRDERRFERITDAGSGNKTET